MRTHSLLTTLGIGLALLLGAACDAGEPESSDESSSAESQSAGSDKMASLGKNAKNSKSAGLKLKKGKQAGRQKALKKKLKMMKKMRKMKEKALKAGREAEAQGSTPCEKAFFEAVATADSIRKQQGKKAAQNKPEKSEFVSRCKKLPEGMRKCLVPSYAEGHKKKCSKLHDGLSAEEKSQLKNLMKKAQ